MSTTTDMHPSTEAHIRRFRTILEASRIGTPNPDARQVDAHANNVFDGAWIGPCPDCGGMEPLTSDVLVYYTRHGNPLGEWMCEACLASDLRCGAAVLVNPEEVVAEIDRILALDREDPDGRKREATA